MGKAGIAERIQNALLRTLEDGIHTGDIYKTDTSSARVGTKAFAEAVIQRLGQNPQRFAPVKLNHDAKPISIRLQPLPQATKALCGIDVFLDWSESDKKPDVLGNQIHQLNCEPMQLDMISNRGVVVYPDGHPSTFCTSHWRCRFKTRDGQNPVYHDLLNLQQKLTEAGLQIIKTENLYTFDDKPGYSLSQGEH
jgi:isocitrate dehydrogenase